MFFDFTKQEQAQADAIEDKYQKAFKALEELTEQLNPTPNTEYLFEGINGKDNPKEWEEAIKKETKILNKWEAAGSQEWKAARKKWFEINDAFNKERSELFKKAELRAFNELNGDITKIFEDAKTQVTRIIYELYQFFNNGSGEKKLLDGADVKERIVGSLHLHIEALRDNNKLSKDLTLHIDNAIKRSEYIAPKGTHSNKVIDPCTIISTKYPINFVAPTDKVSNLAFCGELNSEQVQQLAMERRGSKKQITTIASINFDDLNGSVQIRGRKELTAYDREVHDAIITLFVDGTNEYITPQMIYQVMTGNNEAKLNPKQAEAISDSITKCMYSRVTIDASEEAKAYGFEKFKYDGNLISGERVTATLNGNVLECLHILRTPVLYELASLKNQIGRFDIKLLNSPINKTEEIITLQGYLYRRILSMRGGNLSKTIVYETVYNQIDVSAASDGALRKKKSKVRDQIKTILDYWKQEDFILGYCENKRGQEVYSVTIRV
jgi:hypothetical protein